VPTFPPTPDEPTPTPEVPSGDRPPSSGPSSGPSTEHRFLTSSLAAYGSQFGRVAIRLAADIALARLILPTAHGVFDLAWSAVLIAGVVRDAGVSYQLVRDEREPYGTALVWSLISGVLVTAALIAASPLFGPLNPALPLVLAGLAPWLLLDGVAAVPRVYFERHLRVGRLVVPELLRGLTFAVVAVTLGTLGVGVWSFVAGELAGVTVVAAMLWLRVRGRFSLAPRWDLLGSLLARSRYLFLIALSAFTLPHVERYVLGPFVATATLAQYNKARLWGLRLQTIVVPAVQRVLYPALVAYQGDEERSFGVYRIGTVTILGLEVLAAYFLFLNAETVLVTVLLGPAWKPAVPLVRILCFLPLVDPFSRLGGELLKVRTEDRLWLVIVLLNSASLLGFGLPLAHGYGATGMAVTNFLLLGNLLMTWRVWRICGPRFWRLAADLAVLYLVPLPFFATTRWLFPEEGWGRFSASVIAGSLAVLILALRFRRPFLDFFRHRPPT
jgi:O-antigen/teichoic acid export membrane protein